MASVDGKTVAGYVLTDDGHIPHLKHPKTDLMMPIKVVIEGGDVSPMKRGNKRVYALPGGGEFCA